MHEAPAAHYVRRGLHASCGMFSEVYPVGSLPPRGNQGIWGGRRLGYELGAEDLNGWVPMLGAQALLAVITLGPKCWLRSDVWPTGKCVPVWRRIVGCSFRLGLFGKLRDGILLYCGSHFPQRASTGKRVPEFAIKMGWSFHRPPARKKASGAVALEAFRLHANGCASYSWLDARRHGRSCIPRQWG